MKLVWDKFKWVLLGMVLMFLVFVPNMVEYDWGEKGQTMGLAQHGLVLGLNILVLVLLLFVTKKGSFMPLDKQLLSWKVPVYGLGLMLVMKVFDVVGARLLELSQAATTANQEDLINGFQYSHPVNIFFLVVLLGPLAEELIFRGVIFEKLFPKHTLLAILASTFLFGLNHGPENLVEWFIYGSSGLVLALAYAKTRKLEYGLLAHMLTNGLVFVMTTFF